MRAFWISTALTLTLIFTAAPIKAQDVPPPPEEKDDRPIPEKIRAHLSEGASLYSNGSFDKAAVSFDKVIELSDQHPVARYYRGLIRVIRMDYDGALKDFDVVLKIRPKSARVMVQRGRAHMALNRFKEALADFSAAAVLDPEGMQKNCRIDREIAQARALQSSLKTVGPGGTPPVFKGMTASGSSFDLSNSLGKEYIVLVFYTTWANSGCRNQLSMWSEFLTDFAKIGVTLIALSTDSLKYGIELRENKGLKVRILSDEKGKIIKAFGLQNVRTPKPARALPAVVVIDKAGRIAYRHVAYDPRVRMGPEKVLHVIAGLIKRDKAVRGNEEKKAHE